MNEPRIIVALDFNNAKQALNLAAQLDPQLCRLKIGKELFTATGPSLVEQLIRDGFDIFLDLKFHDIPNTVAGACKAAANMGVWMMNVHALGGKKMLLAAREAVPPGAAKLIAVTLLTSMGPDDLDDIGLHEEPEQVVRRLAILTENCGLDGVVCSALETAGLRQHVNSNFKLVTPGIRLENDNHGDQKRVTTPSAAVKNGADYLVIGRPVTQSPDPLCILRQLNHTVQNESVVSPRDS
ncbi:orotidine-5'-phosphate decarboxylase [Nitrosomonas sp. Nm51]|uniref:orotidine-5'-phosphate decarboxylase n=1 Tax=Nitrosomonas sp. Nm51 TaxID=133720 RepID=UPI0008BF9E9C|nr:orotidine-5'-phosphate decarboxylase [Nitrosomonas sp. Nm51]SEQ90398.1 orotidine-5'-phosphate decarboxylase [Nitrosomonas sp. Nm51]